MQKNDPRYLFVKQYILDGIGSGLWAAGDRVPSENELCDLCKVSRMTARRALEELHQSGTLVRVKGRGSFVAEHKQQSSLLQIRSIDVELKQLGYEHSSKMLECSRQPVTPQVAERLDLGTDDECGYSKILHYQNGRPIQLEERWVNLSVVPEYTEQDFSQITPSAYLSSIAPVTKAEHCVEAIIGDEFVRFLLDLEPEEAILLLERKTCCNEKAVSFARLFHPGNRYRLGTQFNPGKLQQDASGPKATAKTKKTKAN